MQRFDWKRAETEPTGGPEGFSGRAAVIGKAIGAEHLAGQLIVLEPGDRPFPYHWEAGQEEWLLVLGGEPTVRTPEGEHALRPGDVVCFPVGPAGAHRVEPRLRPGPVDHLLRPVHTERDRLPRQRQGRRPRARRPRQFLDKRRRRLLGRRGVKVFNVFDGELGIDDDEPDGYRAPYASLRERIGAERLGGTVVLLRTARPCAPTTTSSSRRSGSSCSRGRRACAPPAAR